MTIDAFDWAHRTGANPPDEPTADPCTSRPARPHLYEGTFAHEWQHLLQYYTDPFETNWINEGLSDFAQTLVGYVDATATVDQPGADSHLYCFQGFGTVQTPYNPNPRDCGGAQNSLTLWGEDPNPAAVLADYGNAYSMMLYLYDRFGTDFMSALHRDGEHQGLASLAARARRTRASTTPTRSSTTSSRWCCSTRSSATPSTRSCSGADKRRRHHAEPALDGQPRQPGVLRHPRRRTQRRRLRGAARRRRQGAQGQQAEVADLRRAPPRCRPSRSPGPS